MSNVVDRAYATAGQLGRRSFGAQGAFTADAEDWRQRAVRETGARRAGWVGVRTGPLRTDAAI